MKIFEKNELAKDAGFGSLVPRKENVYAGKREQPSPISTVYM
jgi:hypothetical protein